MFRARQLACGIPAARLLTTCVLRVLFRSHALSGLPAAWARPVSRSHTPPSNLMDEADGWQENLVFKDNNT